MTAAAEKVGIIGRSLVHACCASGYRLSHLDKEIQRFQALPSSTRAVYERAAHAMLVANADLGPDIFDFSTAMSVLVGDVRSVGYTSEPITTVAQAIVGLQRRQANPVLDARLRKLLIAFHADPQLEAALPGWRRAPGGVRPRRVTAFQRLMAIAITIDLWAGIECCEPNALDTSANGAELFDTALSLWCSPMTEAAVNELRALGMRFRLPSYRLLLEQRHLASVIYTHAPSDVRAERDRLAQQAAIVFDAQERERQTTLAAWRQAFDHLDDNALRQTSHRRGAHGTIEPLYSSFHAYLVHPDGDTSNDNVLTVNPCNVLSQPCTACQGELIRFFDFDLTDARLAPLRLLVESQPGARTTDHIELVGCIGCIYNGLRPETREVLSTGSSLSTYVRDGLAAWRTLQPDPHGDAFTDLADKFSWPAGIREMRPDDPREACGLSSRVGGYPRWHSCDAPCHPQCVRCKQAMVALASLDIEHLLCANFFYCARCEVSTIVHQFDA